jgi:hypothetical protein
VKKIRNRFAHDLSLTFDEPEICKLCAELSQLCETQKYRKTERTPKEIFQDTIAFLAGTLREHLYLSKIFQIKGTFKKVFNLAFYKAKYSKKIE